MQIQHDDPHRHQPVLQRGAPLSQARLAMILVHGRGAAASDIMSVGEALGLDGVAYLAPQAGNNTWYPYSFLAPIPQNEPGISSGLSMLSRLIARLGDDGLPPARIGLLGFSQGACLSLEYAARHAQRYAAIVGFSGGLIGPPGTPRDYSGTLDATPVFLGCSNIDPHIPLERVHETGDVFRRMGASVDERIYPGMGHTINEDEIETVRRMLR